MPEALDHEAKIAIADLGVEHTAHGVALGGPEMQQALVVLAGDGVLGVGQVEDAGAVLKYGRVAGTAEKVFQQAAERFRGHVRILPATPDLSVTDEHPGLWVAMRGMG